MKRLGAMIDTLEGDLKKIKEENKKQELTAFKAAKQGEETLNSCLNEYD